MSLLNAGVTLCQMDMNDARGVWNQKFDPEVIWLVWISVYMQQVSNHTFSLCTQPYFRKQCCLILPFYFHHRRCCALWQRLIALCNYPFLLLLSQQCFPGQKVFVLHTCIYEKLIRNLVKYMHGQEIQPRISGIRNPPLPSWKTSFLFTWRLEKIGFFLWPDRGWVQFSVECRYWRLVKVYRWSRGGSEDWSPTWSQKLVFISNY